ncbi:unnamed protein product, partial [marine sediment metagenome]
ITDKLTSKGCNTIRDANAIKGMKELGGYSNIIQNCINIVLEKLSDNPRIVNIHNELELKINAQKAKLREQTQLLLNHVYLYPSFQKQSNNQTGKQRYPLSLGTHREVRLVAESLKWIGIADLIILTNDLCEIIDYKTSDQSDSHKSQLITYALLWMIDKELNPSKRLANKLTIAYPNGTIDVPPPSNNELKKIEIDLINRSKSSTSTLKEIPPRANPHKDICQYCSVKQLCETYWMPLTQKSFSTGNNDSPFIDL